jgi:peptidoglycan hydrolase-like amidase
VRVKKVVSRLVSRGAWVSLCATSVVVAALMVGGAASAQSAWAGDFVFKGRGYGHGVGLSQWGAWQAARDGKDFRFILDFYYPGATLDPLGDPGLELTVKLSSEPWKSVSTITQNFAVTDVHAVGAVMTLVKHGAAGEQTEDLAAGAFCTMTPKDGAIQVVTAAGGKQGPFDWVEARPATGGRTKVQFRTTVDATPLEAREYWGKMRVEPSPTAGYLTVFNLVPIEKYLRSIAEVDYDWARPNRPAAYAPEAVKSQAVAARTYAVANRDPYLNDNQWDQVYRGYTFEQTYPGIGQAAEQTTVQGAGLVLRYQGKVISSFFSSSSGGYTTEWDQGEYPYLPAKADPYSLRAPADNPGYAWIFTISAAELSEVVDGMGDIDGRAVHVGTVSRVEVLSRDTADPKSHAATLRLTGDKGAAVVGASAFRRFFGYSRMRSTLILEITSPAGPPPPPGEFTDVPPQHMYYDEIDQVTDAGLMNGYPSGEFRPETAVSRWQFAKMVVGLHNALFPADQIPLVDVPARPFADMPAQPGTLGDESDWVAAAFDAGLVNGVTATTFQPYDAVRRDQMASMLVRAMGWEDEAEALPAETPGFADVPLANMHHAAATYLKSVDVLKGYSGPDGSVELRPTEPIKRMHVAVILSRLLGVTP